MCKLSRRLARRRGLTLIEVMLVLVILVIIASLAIVAIGPMRRNAYRKAAEIHIKSFEGPLDIYCGDVGEYPTTAQGLEALRTRPSDLANPRKWAGPYLRDIPIDPWGQPYRYEYPGKRHMNEDFPDIWSLGHDRTDGTENDIGNWMTADMKE